MKKPHGFRIKIGQQWQSKNSDVILTVWSKKGDWWICVSNFKKSHKMRGDTLQRFYTLIV